MKKILPLLLCLMLLAGCVNKAEPLSVPPSVETTAQLEGFKFTEENYPRVDGSTATIPLIEAVECALLGKPRSEVSVSVSKTSGAYLALAQNEADVLLVYDGGDETRSDVSAALIEASSQTDLSDESKLLIEGGFDALFETVPIGKDALVFLVNRDNPIENLSTQQVQKIFSGEYTNWSELGGSDEPIRAYQRGIGSGSQALMDKLVMDSAGLQMADPAKVPVIGSMGGLVDAVADFAGGPAGIGYNVFFYVTEMRENDYIKILSIDGVEPTYDTIQSGEYPFVSEFYSVIRGSEPEDSPARALHEWMLSDEAQNLMASENYVALHANPNADTPYIEGEFSAYPPGEAPEYFEGVNLYSLEARKDYGQLYFYLGATRTDDAEFGVPQFYGLCTERGKIVTKPVYTTPQLLTDSDGNKAYFCYRSDLAPASELVEVEDWSYERYIYPALLFATDGSWVKEFEGAELFQGFAGVTDHIMNADVLAVRQGGKWGAVNLKGETVIPFNRDSYKGIYSNPNTSADYSYLGVTGDRFMKNTGIDQNECPLFDLYDAELNLIATELRGWPSPMSGEFIVTREWGEKPAINTYTLDGELIASLVSSDEVIYQGAAPLGDYVHVYAEKSTMICDRKLNILYELTMEYNEQYNSYYSIFYPGPNVLYSTDRENLFHRTYLPDGTRLVTWYDPEMR